MRSRAIERRYGGLLVTDDLAQRARLDGNVDWTHIAEPCQDACRAVAPARLGRAL